MNKLSDELKNELRLMVTELEEGGEDAIVAVEAADEEGHYIAHLYVTKQADSFEESAWRIFFCSVKALFQSLTEYDVNKPIVLKMMSNLASAYVHTMLHSMTLIDFMEIFKGYSDSLSDFDPEDLDLGGLEDV